jgi:pilus assembly protein Flp/PilA
VKPSGLFVGNTTHSTGRHTLEQHMPTSFLRDDSGATAIEYGLIAAIVCIGMLVGLQNLGTAVVATYEMIADLYPG